MNQLIAAVIYDGVADTIIMNDGGVETIVRNGPGDYSIVLANGGVDPTEGIWSAQVIGQNANNSIAINPLTDTAVRLFTFDKGVGAADRIVSLKVERRPFV